MTQLRTTLYLDDVRTPTETLPNSHPWVVVRNYDDFVDHINTHGIPDVISFDHDLADEHMADYYAQMLKQNYQIPSYEHFKEKTGLDCARYLIRFSERTGQPIKTCIVHSHNPVGSENIMKEINGFKKHMGWPADCFRQRLPFTIKTKTDV